MILLSVIVLSVLFLILMCKCDKPRRVEKFGMDDRPFEPDNTLLHRNPWDDVDYIRPVFLV